MHYLHSIAGYFRNDLAAFPIPLARAQNEPHIQTAASRALRALHYPQLDQPLENSLPYLQVKHLSSKDACPIIRQHRIEENSEGKIVDEFGQTFDSVESYIHFLKGLLTTGDLEIVRQQNGTLALIRGGASQESIHFQEEISFFNALGEFLEAELDLLSVEAHIEYMVDGQAMTAFLAKRPSEDGYHCYLSEQDYDQALNNYWDEQSQTELVASFKVAESEEGWSLENLSNGAIRLFDSRESLEEYQVGDELIKELQERQEQPDAAIHILQFIEGDQETWRWTLDSDLLSTEELYEKVRLKRPQAPSHPPEEWQKKYYAWSMRFLHNNEVNFFLSSPEETLEFDNLYERDEATLSLAARLKKEQKDEATLSLATRLKKEQKSESATLQSSFVNWFLSQAAPPLAPTQGQEIEEDPIYLISPLASLRSEEIRVEANPETDSEAGSETGSETVSSSKKEPPLETEALAQAEGAEQIDAAENQAAVPQEVVQEVAEKNPVETADSATHSTGVIIDTAPLPSSIEGAESIPEAPQEEEPALQAAAETQPEPVQPEPESVQPESEIPALPSTHRQRTPRQRYLRAKRRNRLAIWWINLCRRIQQIFQRICSKIRSIFPCAKQAAAPSS
ncbi:MAG: hypothetical protein K0S07_171 [Chlamydiales bacterium]|jgi:hypothetical protein|nr:hypothetical protein [Chlamydiales bacterium]